MRRTMGVVAALFLCAAAACSKNDDGEPLRLPVDPSVPAVGDLPDRTEVAKQRQPWDNFRPHEPLKLRFDRRAQAILEQYEKDFVGTLLSQGVIDFRLEHAFYKKGWVSREDREGQMKRFMAFIEEHPDEPQYKANLIVALTHIGFEEEALELAGKWKGEDWFKERWDPNFYVGTVLFRQGRYEEAVPYLEQALQLDPRQWTRLWLRLALAHREGDEAAARREKLFDFGEHMGPDDPSQFPFVDRSDEWGIGRWALAGSIAFADFDNDTLLDMMLTASYYAPELYMFEPDKGLVRKDDETVAGLSHLTPSVLAADFDNDGWTDVFMASAAWFGAGPNRLLRNDEGKGFTDVSDRGDTRLLMQNSTGAAALDFDRDGLLDIVTSGIKGGEARLLKNMGDFRFEEVTEKAGILAPDRSISIHLTVGDVNDDGWPDIFVNPFGPNRLYINQKDGTFKEEAAERGVRDGTDRGFATWMFDYDNDGDLDILAGNFAQSDEQYQGGFGAFDVETFSVPGEATGSMARSRLFKNDGTGHFEDVSEEAGFVPCGVMGAQFVDMNLDGRPEVVLAPGSHPLQNMQPLFVYRNEGGDRFTNVTPVSNPRYYGKLHGVAFADLDRDGDPDLYVNNGGVILADHWQDLVLENTTTGKHWLHLKLEGTESNRSAVGARVEVHVGDRLLMQEVAVGQGFGATNSPYLIFGLDDAESVKKVVIRWPSGEEQVLPALEADQALVVTEDEDDLRRVY